MSERVGVWAIISMTAGRTVQVMVICSADRISARALESQHDEVVQNARAKQRKEGSVGLVAEEPHGVHRTLIWGACHALPTRSQTGLIAAGRRLAVHGLAVLGAGSIDSARGEPSRRHLTLSDMLCG